MTKVSRYPLPKEDWEEFYDQICKALAMLESKREIKDFLDDLFTYTEKKMLSKRVQVARNLIQGITYNIISTRLHVTDTMISAVNDVLNSRGRGYEKVHEVLTELEEEKLEKVKKAAKRAEERIITQRGMGIEESIEAGLRLINAKSRKVERKQSAREE